MIARRMSPRSSALSNQGRWGFAAPGMASLGAVRFGKAGGVGAGGARWRKVGFGLVCPGKAGMARRGVVG